MPDHEEVFQRHTVVAFGVEAGKVYRRKRGGAALQIRDGVGYLSPRDGVGLFGGHFFQEGEIEDDRGIAPRVAFSDEPPLIEM